MYKTIKNPKTGKQISINSKLGRQILHNYINYVNGGTLGLIEHFDTKIKPKIKIRYNNFTIRDAVHKYLDIGIEWFIYRNPIEGAIGDWDVSGVTDMSFLFPHIHIFNHDIENWNVSNVTTMESMFEGCQNFNQPLNNWNVSNVTSMRGMFKDCQNFNQTLNNWNVFNVTSMHGMFEDCYKFNQPLNKWNVSNVTNMSSMFKNCRNFNQTLSNWHGEEKSTSKVTNMSSMFAYCYKFNQPLNNWNVSNVTTMEKMFLYCYDFNQPLNDWIVSNVTNMSHMFYRATNFNKPLYKWDVSRVNNMTRMFHKATNFNQPLNDWNVTNVVNAIGMFHDSGFQCPGNLTLGQINALNRNYENVRPPPWLGSGVNCRGTRYLYRKMPSIIQRVKDSIRQKSENQSPHSWKGYILTRKELDKDNDDDNDNDDETDAAAEDDTDAAVEDEDSSFILRTARRLKSFILEYTNLFNLPYPINVKLTTGEVIYSAIGNEAALMRMCRNLVNENPALDIYDLALSKLVILNSDGNELVTGLTWDNFLSETLRNYLRDEVDEVNQMNLLELILDFRNYSGLKYPFYIEFYNEVGNLPIYNYIDNRENLETLIDQLLELNRGSLNNGHDFTIKNSDRYGHWISAGLAMFKEKKRLENRYDLITWRDFIKTAYRRRKCRQSARIYLDRGPWPGFYFELPNENTYRGGYEAYLLLMFNRMTSLEYPYYIHTNVNTYLIQNEEELLELMSTTLGYVEWWGDHSNIINNIEDLDFNNKFAIEKLKKWGTDIPRDDFDKKDLSKRELILLKNTSKTNIT